MIPDKAVEGMDITEFLEARITQDVAQAKYVQKYGATNGLAPFSPARVLAECAAKRAILSDYANAVAGEPWRSQDAIKTYERFAAAWTFTLRHLAAVYADHPDYQKGWVL